MKAIFRLLLLMLFSQIVWAQTPGIPYQAVIMDKESGQELPGLDNSYANPLRNSLVSIRFSIHDINGMEFEETHHSVIVDDYGMINLIVGKGVYTYMDFYDDMDWNGEEKWLKVEIDFENGNDFENLDYLPIHRIPNPDDQKLSLSGDSLILEDGGGVSLTDLLSGAGVDEQQISLVGNVIYLENGGSIDLTDLLADAGTDNQRLTLTGTILNLEDGGTVNLANLLANVDTDNQNLTYISLNGTILEVDIEDGDSVSTNLVGLASDSAFVNNFIANQDFIDAIQLHELDGDPTNELNTNFTVLGNFLRITDGGGVLSVPLSMIQIDTMGLSNRIDQIILNDNDQDPTNEIQYLSISNDTLYLSDGNAVYLGAISSDNDQDSTNEIQTLSFSNDTLYLTEGGSVDLTSLALDLDTAYRQGDSLFIILDDFQDTTIVDLGSPDVGTDNQNLAYITLTGTDLEVDIEDGDSVKVDLIGLASDSTFVTTLATDSVFSTTLATDSIFTTTLAHDSTFVSELTTDSIFLANLDTLDDDNQSLTYITLTGTDLEVDIEDGDSVKVDLIGLASDSTFVTTLATDSVFSTTLATDSTFINTLTQDTTFINNLQANEVDGDTTNEIQFLSISNDTLYLSDGNDVYLGAISSDLDQDSTNEWNTAFEIFNDSLFITDAGGSFGVPLDSIMFNDNDQDSTNEIQLLSISNDTLYLSDGNDVYLGAISSDLDQDSTNEWNTAFEIFNDSLFITDAGGSFGVPLDSIMFNDNDQDSTNEWNTAFEISNDSLFITDAGGSFGVPLDSIVNEPWNTVGTTEGHTTNTGDMYYMGNLAVGQNTTTAGKVATFAGDVDVQGVLDPTKLVFSNSAGTNSSFVPSTDGAYEIEFTEGMDLSFKSDATDSILHLENAGNVGVGTASPQAKLHIAGNVRIDDAPIAAISDSVMMLDPNGFIKQIASTSLIITENDGDSTNEIQSISIANDSLFLTDGGVVDLSPYVEDTLNELNTGFNVSSGNLNIIDAGGTKSVALSAIQVDTTNLSNRIDSIVAGDNDQDPNNELQTLSLVNDTLTLSNGNSVVLSPLAISETDGDTANELQTIDMFSLSGNTVFLSLENDGEAPKQLDLSVLQDGTGTDDQLLSLSGNTLTLEDGGSVDLSTISATEIDGDTMNELNTGFYVAGGNLNITDAGGTKSVALSSLQDGTGTDDQNISGSYLFGNQLIIGIEGGLSDTVDLAALNSAEVDGDTLNEIQDIDLLNLTGTTLEISLSEKATSHSVNLSALQDGTGTDTQDLSLVGNTLYLTDGGNVDLSTVTTNEVDGDTLNEIQTIDQLSLVGSTLYMSLENDDQTPSTLDLSSLQDGTGTDDQQLTLVGANLSIEDGNTVDLSVLQDGTGTDDQTVDVFALSGTTLSLSIEDDGVAPNTVDLSALQDGTGTDTQDLSLIGNTLYLTDGGNVDLSTITTNEVDGDVTNEIQSVDAFNLSGTTLSISLENDGVAPSTLDLSSLQDGTGTDDQQLTFAGTNLTIEDGNTVDLSSLQDGTGTDDQTVDIFALSGTTLSLSIEDDGVVPNTVDLSSLQDGTGTDDQQLTLIGTNLTIEDGNTIDLSTITTEVDGDVTNEIQTVDAFALSGTTLNLSLSSDGVAPSTVDLSALQDGTGTDTQDLSLIGNTLYLTDGGNVDLSTITTNEVDGDVTNEIQSVDAFNLSGTTLSISLENDGVAPSTLDLSSLQDGIGTDDQQLTFAGTNLTIEDGNTVDLSSLQDGTGTDDQTVDIFALSGTTLSLSIEDDGVVPNTVDLSALQDGTGTDDQQLTLIGTNLTIEDGNTVDLATITTEVDGDVTNEIQTVDAFALSGTTLSISLEDDGVAPSSVDLSSLQDGTGTDTQDLSLIANTLYLTDGGNVDLSTITTNEIDGDTMNELNTGFNVSGGNLNIIDAGGTKSVALTALQDGTGTDDQNISGSFLSGTDLTIGIEGGTSETIDLSSLATEVDGDVTNEIQTVDAFNLSGTTLSISLENDNVLPSSVDLSSLQDGTGTDTQDLSLIGNILYLTDGGNVDLSTISATEVDGDTLNEIQTVDAFSLSGTTLSISLENDDVLPSSVDLSSLQDGTGTDTQDLSLIGNTLYLTDGGNVDLSTITTNEVDGDVTNEIQSVDAFSLSGTTLSISLENDGVAPSTVDLSSLQDGTGTDDQQLTFAGTNLTIEAGNTVDLSSLQDGTGTDDQTVDVLTLDGTTLNLSLEDDGVAPNTLDLSSLVGTDDQTIDVLTLVGDTMLNISLESDAEATQTLDLSPLKDGDAWAVDGEDTTNLARRIGDVQVVVAANPSGLAQEIVTNFEAFNDANFAYYNAALGVNGTIHGNNASLFNDAVEGGGNSYHTDRITAGQDWGFGYTFGTSYYITSVRIQAQSDGGAWNLRTGGGEFRLYNGGTLVYTSSTIAAASGPSAWTTAAVPNIVADEVRYIFPNGVNTSHGGDIFNACEFEIVGQIYNESSTLIFADVSENNFGVGTDSPDTKLHVEGNAKITAMDAGSSTDEIVVVDSDGLLKKVSSSSVGSDDQTISIDGDSLRIEDGNAVALSDLSSDSWELSGNSGTTAGTNFVGTTDAQDLVFKTNNVEAARFKSGDQRLLFANTGDFNLMTFPLGLNSAVLGIDGTTHSRLRLTAGDSDTRDDSKGASIDLHGNNATTNTGVLDLVAGSAASGTNGAIKFWTNTDGSTQQTSAVLTGAGNFGIGANIIPSQRLDVDGGARVRSLPLGTATDSVVVVDATGVLKKVAQGSATHTIQTLTSSGSVNSDTDVLLVTPGANMTVTIPAIGTGAGEFPEGYELKIKRTSAAGNTITLSPTSSTIDGQATRTLNIGYQSMTLVATSSGWFIID